MINFEKQFDNILEKYQEIETTLSNQSNYDSEKLIKLNKEYAELKPIVDTINIFKKHKTDIVDLRILLNDRDNSIKEMAEDELKNKKKKIKVLENDLLKLLIPKDENDKKNSILEIRAGTGGDEASLFAADLFNMYKKYADIKKWKFEVLSISETELQGIKEVICNITGNNVFARLKFESGVHRVQRIPLTETSGRVHTSAATVAVLPEADEVDVNIKSEDLQIDIFHASGHGGQNVQKVATAVRITHKETGIVAVCQDERSQFKNKEKALSVLRARLLAAEIEKQTKEITDARRSQVGSGDRSERIRTYNFPQGRVTDHRISLTSFNLDQFMDGDIMEFVEGLLHEEQSLKLRNAQG